MISGGTGRFADVMPSTLAAWGAINLNFDNGQLSLRYEGTLCFRPVTG